MRLLNNIAILIFSLFGQGLCYSSVGDVEVFYVKLTESTECPSGDSPCHS